MRLDTPASLFFNMISSVFFLLVLSISVYCDLKTREVPNYLTYTGALLALVTTESLSGAFVGAFVCFAALLVLYSTGSIGGGDVKLGAVIGGFSGVTSGITSIAVAHLVASIVSLIRLKFANRQPKEIPLAGFYLSGVVITWFAIGF